MKTAFFLGQTGGSGSGDFALIKIEYPQGQRVAVTFNGSTEEAPDTSGIWMYGCDEIGTYIVSIVGTSIQQQVQITTKGQIETIWISNQVVNYALIYHIGEEFATTIPSQYTGGSAILTGGWSYKAYTPNAVPPRVQTGNVINYENAVKMFAMVVSAYAGNSHYEKMISGASETAPTTNQFFQEAVGSGTNIGKHLRIGYDVVSIDNGYIAFGLNSQSSVDNFFQSVTKEATYMSLVRTITSPTSIPTKIYAMGFVKQDDLSGLSAYGNTISSIIANSSSLLNDANAISWMLLHCTGDFMISAITDTTFNANMKASQYYYMIQANEHWNRFITTWDLIS